MSQGGRDPGTPEFVLKHLKLIGYEFIFYFKDVYESTIEYRVKQLLTPRHIAVSR